MIKIKDNPFVGWVEYRIKKNKNAVISLNGGVGSGKSWASLYYAKKIAEKLGTEFSPRLNMDFNFAGMMEKMKLPCNQKPGTVFIFEEVGTAGSGASYREWQGNINKFFQSFMQTWRHRNNILIMNSPVFGYLEKGVRQLVNLQITMIGINKHNGTSFGRPLMLQTNVLTGKTYHHTYSPKYDGKKVKINNICFKKPNYEVIQEYEEMKSHFTTKLNKDMLDSLKPKEKVTKLLDVLKHIDKIKKFKEDGANNIMIGDMYGVSYKTIERALSMDKKDSIQPNLLGKVGFQDKTTALTPL